MARYKVEKSCIEEQSSSSESTHSALSASDWRKIERLLKEVVTDVFDKRARKLNDTIQDLATSNIILQHRVVGYERALKNEKKKRKRAKPLFRKLALAEDGGATFFSPHKIQQARDLREEAEKAKDHKQALKVDERLQRQLQKDEKRRLIDQRKEQ